jgi:ribosomal protein L2
LQDGTFEFDFVPEGRYVISVEGAKDTKGRIAQAEGRAIFVVDTLRKFGTAQLPVIVQTTDVKNLVLEVPAGDVAGLEPESGAAGRVCIA